MRNTTATTSMKASISGRNTAGDTLPNGTLTGMLSAVASGGEHPSSNAIVNLKISTTAAAGGKKQCFSSTGF